MSAEIERFTPPEVTEKKVGKAGGPQFEVGLVGSVVKPRPLAPAPQPIVEQPSQSVSEVIEDDLYVEQEVVVDDSYTEQDLASSRTKGFEDGYAKGYDAAKSDSAELDRQIEQSLEKVIGQLENLAVKIEEKDTKTVKQLTQLAMVVARKMTGDALEDVPLSDIETTIQQSMRLLFDEAKITVFVSPELVGSVMQRVRALSKKEGFSGEVDIQGNENIAKGDCEVQWYGGGVKSNKEKLWKDIEKICGLDAVEA